MTRTPALQNLLDAFAEEFDIPQRFRDASEHRYNCRCDKCLSWWASMGPDGEPEEEGAWGPFTWEEIKEYKED